VVTLDTAVTTGPTKLNFSAPVVPELWPYRVSRMSRPWSELGLRADAVEADVVISVALATVCVPDEIATPSI
jgi:hypothetical protein